MLNDDYKLEFILLDFYILVVLVVGVYIGILDNNLDLFLGYLDVSVLDWDMFGN